MSSPSPDHPAEPAGADAPAHPNADGAAGHAACPECAARGQAPAEQFVYALGRIEARFPSLGLEREFQQRERVLGAQGGAGRSRIERMGAVLEHNPHIAARMCYLLTVGGSPAYLLAPAGHYLRKTLFEALLQGDQPDAYVVVVGRLGPMAPPQACAGVLAPLLMCDQMYNFRLADWLAALTGSVAQALEERQIEPRRFGEIAGQLFGRLVQSTENVGATDVHRALNYLLMQHPGMFLLAAEKQGRHVLDRIETRVIQGPSARKQVAVILSFAELSTGLAERFFTRVDVSEEWPFVTDAEGARGPLGLSPYIDSSLLGMPL